MCATLMPPNRKKLHQVFWNPFWQSWSFLLIYDHFIDGCEIFEVEKRNFVSQALVYHHRQTVNIAGRFKRLDLFVVHNWCHDFGWTPLWCPGYLGDHRSRVFTVVAATVVAANTSRGCVFLYNGNSFHVCQFNHWAEPSVVSMWCNGFCN